MVWGKRRRVQRAEIFVISATDRRIFVRISWPCNLATCAAFSSTFLSFGAASSTLSIVPVNSASTPLITPAGCAVIALAVTPRSRMLVSRCINLLVRREIASTLSSRVAASVTPVPSSHEIFTSRSAAIWRTW